jgi:hypothetical protein
MNRSGVIPHEETRYDSDPNPGQRNPPGIRQSRHLGQRDVSPGRGHMPVPEQLSTFDDIVSGIEEQRAVVARDMTRERRTTPDRARVSG